MPPWAVSPTNGGVDETSYDNHVARLRVARESSIRLSVSGFVRNATLRASDNEDMTTPRITSTMITSMSVKPRSP